MVVYYPFYDFKSLYYIYISHNIHMTLTEVDAHQEALNMHNGMRCCTFLCPISRLCHLPLQHNPYGCLRLVVQSTSLCTPENYENYKN